MGKKYTKKSDKNKKMAKKKKYTPLTIFESTNVPGFGEVFIKTHTSVESERKIEKGYRAQMKKRGLKIPKGSRYYKKKR